MYVCRPVAVWKEFTKLMPPGELTVIGRCLDDDSEWCSVRRLDGDSPVAGRRLPFARRFWDNRFHKNSCGRPPIPGGIVQTPDSTRTEPGRWSNKLSDGPKIVWSLSNYNFVLNDIMAPDGVSKSNCHRLNWTATAQLPSGAGTIASKSAEKLAVLWQFVIYDFGITLALENAERIVVMIFSSPLFVESLLFKPLPYNADSWRSCERSPFKTLWKKEKLLLLLHFLLFPIIFSTLPKTVLSYIISSSASAFNLNQA